MSGRTDETSAETPPSALYFSPTTSASSDSGCFLHKVLARKGGKRQQPALLWATKALEFRRGRQAWPAADEMLQGTRTTALEGNHLATGQITTFRSLSLRSALLLLGRRKNLGRSLSNTVELDCHSQKGRRRGTNGPQAGATSSLPTTSPFTPKLYPIYTFLCFIETHWRWSSLHVPASATQLAVISFLVCYD